MSYVLNTAATFVDDMIDGFVAAHPDLVCRVDGGVVRATATPPGQVAVVIGGGSGHFPAFAGLVGAGLAHGAAMGNVFASPSAQQVYSVARAAASDAGVLLSYGNYGGDVLNFDQAQDRLAQAGVPTRTVVVTDDISSAPSPERHRRRGVAGDLPVFRAAAWAAEQMRTLADVEAITRHANDRTRTLGVAFSGCTLPGAEAPLFMVPPGRMAVGMGIHGEPGVEERPMASADELAELLVSQLLAETPAGIGSGDARVGVLVNGLGSVKSEELYVLYKGVAARLKYAGLIPIAPEIGEFATSFEMAGVSLTLTWLDDELARAWCAPSSAPGYRRGTHAPPAPDRAPADHHLGDTPTPSPPEVAPPGSDSSRRAAAFAVAALHAVRAMIDEHAGELGRLDAVAGDGDHGIGMQRGVRAAAAAAVTVAAAGAGVGSTLVAAADAWADRAGGTSGALWGIALRAVAVHFGDDAAVTPHAVAEGVQAAADAVAAAGHAAPGDKTMLDSFVPFATRLSADIAHGTQLDEAWRAASAVATQAAEATKDLAPRAGRARTHTERSLGTPDPGAVSLALAFAAVASVIIPRERTGA